MTGSFYRKCESRLKKTSEFRPKYWYGLLRKTLCEHIHTTAILYMVYFRFSDYSIVIGILFSLFRRTEVSFVWDELLCLSLAEAFFWLNLLWPKTSLIYRVLEQQVFYTLSSKIL